MIVVSWSVWDGPKVLFAGSERPPTVATAQQAYDTALLAADRIERALIVLATGQIRSPANEDETRL